MMCLLCLSTTLLIAGPPAEPDRTDWQRLEAAHLHNIRQVTRGFERAGEGYFAPDGRTIIYQAVPTGRHEYQIFTQSLDGGKPRMVSTGHGKTTCSFFRPDGRKIIYASTHLDPHADTPPPANPKAQTKYRYSRSARYRWDFDPWMDIFEANPDGTGLKRLTTAWGYDAEGSYSPDGKRIVFCSFRDGDGEIYVMNADGSDQRRLTFTPGYDGGPFFSPDGKRIIFRGDPGQNDLLQLFVMNADGTGRKQLTHNHAVNWGPYWHPDGRHIIYATSIHGHQNYELYLMDLDSGQTERVTYWPGFDALPVFSPDGKRLMWTSKRAKDNTSQLFIADFSLTPSAARGQR